MRQKQDIQKWYALQSSSFPSHQSDRAFSPTRADQTPPKRTSNSVAGKSTPQASQTSSSSEDSEESEESEESEGTLGRSEKGSPEESTEVEGQATSIFDIDKLVDAATGDGQRMPDNSAIADAAHNAILQAKRSINTSPIPTMKAIAKEARAQLSYAIEMRKLGLRGLDWTSKRELLEMIIYLADSEVQGIMYENLRRRTNPDGPEGFLFVPVPGRPGWMRSNFGSSIPRSCGGSNRDVKKKDKEEEADTASTTPAPPPSVAGSLSRRSGAPPNVEVIEIEDD